MPWSGKSTVGVLLAKALRWNFIDTDILIQSQYKMSLQEIIDKFGVDHFRQIEEQQVLSITPHHCVVATGGSVVYSEQAMAHLQSWGYIFYLQYPYKVIHKRARHVEHRGLVRSNNQSLKDLYDERTPLYERWAEFTVPCFGLTHEQVVEEILFQYDSLTYRTNCQD